MLYSVHSFILEVVTPEPLDFTALQAHVPGIKVIENKTSDIEIIFKENSEPKLHTALNRVVVEGAWCESFKHDFPHLIYAVMRTHWINQGLYPVHSICLDNALVVGHSGTGKTTIALEALKQDTIIHSFNHGPIKGAAQASELIDKFAFTDSLSESLPNKSESYPKRKI